MIMVVDDGQTRSWTITNVRVFEGDTVSAPQTVRVTEGLIAETNVETDAEVDGGHEFDAAGGTLLPGLIDAHVHFDAVGNLEVFTGWGVTTALDMGTRAELVADLHDHPGRTDVRSATSPASGPGGLPTASGGFDPSTAVHGLGDAARFVSDRWAEGADYIKIIIEDPARVGPVALSADTIAALVAAAHEHNLMTVAHASSTAAYALGIDAGVDVLTHGPLDAPLAANQIAAMAERNIAAIPTLSMMGGIADTVGMPTDGPGPGYRHVAATVAAMHAAGIAVVAGTDANNTPFVPFSPPQGESIHGELQLLVEAGLTPMEALRSATSSAAELFGLDDRGRIVPGRRADLLLVDGDPTADIRVTRNIRSVWVAGVRAG